MLVQVAYAIGVAEPVGVFVDTYGTSKVNVSDGDVAAKVKEIFDLRPGFIVKRFGLKIQFLEKQPPMGIWEEIV